MLEGSAGQLWRKQVAGESHHVQNMIFYYKIHGDINVDLLFEAVQSLPNYYPILLGDAPKIPETRLRSLEEPIANLLDRLQNEVTEYVFQTYIIDDLIDNSMYWVIKTNHLIVDAYSISLILDYLVQKYKDASYCLEQADRGFENFVKHERILRESKEYRQKVLDIRETLKNAPTKGGLSPCHTYEFEVPSSLIQSLKGMADEHGISVYCVFYGWFACAVNAAFPKMKKAYGLIFSERLLNKAYYKSIGPYSNLYLIKNLDQQEALIDCSHCVFKQVLACMQNHDVRLYDLCQIKPIYINVLFDFNEIDPKPLTLGKALLEEMRMPAPKEIRRDISAKLTKKNQCYSLKIRYNPNHVSHHDIQKLQANLVEKRDVTH